MPNPAAGSGRSFFSLPHSQFEPAKAKIKTLASQRRRVLLPQSFLSSSRPFPVSSSHFRPAPPLRWHQVICPILKRLYLKQLGNRSLSTLFSPEFFRGLINLTQLEVFDCLMLEEIIEFEENEEQRGRNMIKKTIFPQLWLLKLSRLPKIRYFCTFSNALELPSLLDLTIEECPMMIMFVLESCDGSMLNSIPRSFFSKQVICPNLARLHLRQLRIGTLRTLFASEVFRGLIINLERLLEFDCPMLEEMIELEKNEEQRGRNMIEKTIIPRLKFLKLSRLPKIRYFCTFRNALELPSLEWLTIQECPMMMTFALESGNVSMPNSIPGSFLSKEVICPNLKGLDLKHLRIGYLRTLFSLEVFRSLMNLKRLEVFDCPMLEEIIELEKNEEQRERNIIEKTIIPQLWKLELKRLPKIRYFCTFSNALELPSLEDLTIEECPMMMTFALESCNSSMPNSIPRVFFSKQVICPNLERLHVTSCPNLKSLFSYGILGGLTNLQVLEITDCSMLEEVIAKK